MPKIGVLLVGHGTRDARGRAEFLDTANAVAARLPEFLVQPAFLELAEPGIPQAVEALLGAGVAELLVGPLLLFAAGHAKQDIPAAVREALGNRQLPIRQAAHLGLHQQLVELSQQQFAAVLPAETHSSTALLLVGRGSRDPDATREMLEFAACRQQRHPDLPVYTAFYAMAEPALSAIVGQLQQSDYQQVVIQPHLLFHGQILQQIQRVAAQQNEQLSGPRWMVTSHLGSHPQVVAAVLDRLMQALAS